MNASMDYVLARRTDGANPVRIFESLPSLDQYALKGAIKQMPYRTFLETAYWFAVSSVAKSRARMRCQVCNSGTAIAVHHRTYDTHGEEHLNMHDLTVLCEFCHGMFHGHKPAAVAQGAATPSIPSASPPPAVLKPIAAPYRDVEALMPPGERIVLTPQLINRCRVNSAFTKDTIHAFGLRFPLRRRWISKLIGKVISRGEYRQALEGRFNHQRARQ